ncbi:MAG TPA: hypothetical protein VGN48_16430 [Pedococcus sp.]|jgi:hypothetical protein|nr:hypothetical protein [Pedococcus sp.]
MIISRLRAFVAFWYDFIVGDDWRVALGVVLALAVTYALAHSGTHAVWWIAPLAVLALLPLSIRRAAGKRN